MSTYPVSSWQDHAMQDLHRAAQADDPEEAKVCAISALANAVLAVSSALEEIADKMPEP